MGCLYAFDNGVPMLHNMSAPFLNALEDKPQLVISKKSFCRKKGFTRGNTMFGFGNGCIMKQKGSIFEPLKFKKHPEIEHNSIYIYIYTSYIHACKHIYIYIYTYLYTHIKIYACVYISTFKLEILFVGSPYMCLYVSKDVGMNEPTNEWTSKFMCIWMDVFSAYVLCLM